jgi:hypothetical protein
MIAMTSPAASADGSILTQADKINPRGDIVGNYFDIHFKAHAFLLSRSIE